MRRAARESVYQLVFEYTFYGEANEHTLELLTASSDLTEEDREYIASTYYGVIADCDKIREVISSHLALDGGDKAEAESGERATVNAAEDDEGYSNKYYVIGDKPSSNAERRYVYTLDRISRPELTALYIAVYELMKGDLSAAVIINEAVVLAKKYGAEKSGKFVNGVLARVAEDMKG